MPLSLAKIEQEAPALVSLVKSAQVHLEKVGLNGQAAKVALCLDYSGSMHGLYRDGTVQKLAEQVLALGTQFDDDGAIDVFLFDSGATYAGELTISDYKGGVNRLTAGRNMGSTNYAAAMKLVREHYVGDGSAPAKKGFFRKAVAAASQSGPLEHPVYVMFITDGEPDSRPEATRQIVESSREGIFWQFMGVGPARFDYLEQLDTMGGRLIDNAGFFNANNARNDADLYRLMLEEFPQYIPQARQHGLIA